MTLKTLLSDWIVGEESDSVSISCLADFPGPGRLEHDIIAAIGSEASGRAS